MTSPPFLTSLQIPISLLVQPLRLPWTRPGLNRTQLCCRHCLTVLIRLPSYCSLFGLRSILGFNLLQRSSTQWSMYLQNPVTGSWLSCFGFRGHICYQHQTWIYIYFTANFKRLNLLFICLGWLIWIGHLLWAKHWIYIFRINPFALYLINCGYVNIHVL